MNAHRQPIGVFDSGVGGLTVVRALRALLPQESIIYLGDTARVPYGNKAPETIQRYSRNIARYLVEQGAKMIVIACNTASAFAYETVRDAVSVPVVDVIRPVSQAVALAPDTQKVLVLGTRGTVQSGVYKAHLTSLGAHLEITQQACPLFVPLAEEGWTRGDVPNKVATAYLAPVADTQPDSVILGCTHYPLLAGVISDALEVLLGRPVQLFDSGAHAAQAVATALDHAGIAAPQASEGTVRYLVTDAPASFMKVARDFLGEPISAAEHVELADL